MYERKGQAKEPSARTETGEETAENTVRRRLCKQRRKTEQKTITNMQQEEKTHVMAYYTHTRERNKENGRQSRKEPQTPTNKKNKRGLPTTEKAEQRRLTTLVQTQTTDTSYRRHSRKNDYRRTHREKRWA